MEASVPFIKWCYVSLHCIATLNAKCYLIIWLFTQSTHPEGNSINMCRDPDPQGACSTRFGDRAVLGKPLDESSGNRGERCSRVPCRFKHREVQNHQIEANKKILEDECSILYKLVLYVYILLVFGFIWGFLSFFVPLPKSFEAFTINYLFYIEI